MPGQKRKSEDLEHQPVMTPAEKGERFLEVVDRGDVNEIFKLIQESTRERNNVCGTTLFHHAALKGHMMALNALLQFGGLGVNIATKCGKTPLHFAAQEGHTSVVKLLIQEQANVNAQDMLEMTPLQWAVERSHKDVIELLMENGADAGHQDKLGRTCIDIAQRNGNEDFINMCLEHNSIQVTQGAVEGILAQMHEGHGIQEIVKEQDSQENTGSVVAAEGNGYSSVTLSNTPTTSHTPSAETESMKWQESQEIPMMAQIDTSPTTLDNGEQVVLSGAGILGQNQTIGTEAEHQQISHTEMQSAPEEIVFTVNGQMVVVNFVANGDCTNMVSSQPQGANGTSYF